MNGTVTLLRAADYRRMRWKNGGGWTTELAAQPAGAAEFEWRVSVAEVDADCDFSPFPGIDRSILVLAGGGMALEVEGAAAVTLGVGESLGFSGDAATRCRLLAGPTRDFNVMTRRGRYEHSLTRQALDGVCTFEGEALVYLASGAAQVDGAGMAAGDCVRVTTGRLELRGAGALVVVRLRRV